MVSCLFVRNIACVIVRNLSIVYLLAKIQKTDGLEKYKEEKVMGSETKMTFVSKIFVIGDLI